MGYTMPRKRIGSGIIQMRVGADLFEELKQEASESGQAVPAIIRDRLDRDRRGRGSIDRAIADLASIVTARVYDGLFIAPDAPADPQVLAGIRDAMVKVLNDLGAADTSGDTDLATWATFSLAKRIKTPGDDDTPEGKALARIGRALAGVPGARGQARD